MKDLIRKRLDAYESRREQRDEEFAATVSAHIDALNDRSTLWLYIGVLAGVNGLIWASVILLPKDVERAWIMIDDLDTKLPAFVIAVVFGIGMWLTYAIFRIKFPDIENPKVRKGLMSSFEQSEHATKRWRVWLAAVIGGVVNVVALIVLEIYRITPT